MTRKISASFANVKGPTSRMGNTVVGAGRVNEALRADWLRHLALAREKCGFEYVRMHGLLHDDMGVVTSRQGRLHYNFQYIDTCFDGLLEAGVRPFVEFSFMPAVMASDAAAQFFWWRANISPPKDYGQWADLIEALVRHWTRRYGREELARWYFEVWNEPNLKGSFWAGDQAEYFRLYEVTARAVKAVDGVYRVGGPATAGPAWLTDLVNYCKGSGAPLDFLSCHCYGVDGHVDEMGTKGLILNPNPDCVLREIRMSHEERVAAGIPGLELHWTEWGSSYSHRDPIHDAYQQGPWLLRRLRRAVGTVDTLSYWTFTDVFEEGGPGPSPFHGGFGMINLQGLRKPSFFVHEWLHALGREELVCGDGDAFMCRDDRGGVQALFWDYTHAKQDTVNQVYFKRDLPSKPLGEVQVEFSGMRPGAYSVLVRRLGYRANDVYTAFCDLGSPQHLTRDQVAALNAKACGEPERALAVEVGAEGVLSLMVPLRENDVVFVTAVPR